MNFIFILRKKFIFCSKIINMGRVRKPTVIDLFSGCGGLSLGLYKAGWQGLFAIEKVRMHSRH